MKKLRLLLAVLLAPVLVNADSALVIRRAVAVSGGGGGGDPLAFDATSHADGVEAATSHTFSHTTSGNERFLFVCVSHWNGGAPRQASSITYGGQALTLGRREKNAVGDDTAEMWYLNNPPSGANNVVVTMNGTTQGWKIGAISFSGVNQTTPLGTWTGANGTATPATISVASASGDIVIDCLEYFSDGTASPSVGANQTTHYSDEATQDVWGASSRETATGTSTTMNWTLSANHEWESVGVAVKD